MKHVAVSICVVTNEPEHVARVVEVFSRAISGLALEGIDARLDTETLTDADENITEETT